MSKMQKTEIYALNGEIFNRQISVRDNKVQASLTSKRFTLEVEDIQTAIEELEILKEEMNKLKK